MNRHCSWPAFAAALALTVALLPPAAAPAAAAPEGQITFAVHISLAPTWFDPAETAGVITPFMMLYALHDALVKPMPGNAWSPGLAESWTASKDGLVISGGNRSYGGYPDIDALFRDQAVEMDRKRREMLLHRIQQLMHERAMFAPIVEPPFLTGVGPRIGEIPTIAGHPYFSPYEDLKLKGR